MQVLVTGAAGFIGSHVTEALLRRGDEVVGLDSLNDYYDPARKRRNLAEIEETAATSPGKFTFVSGDIRDRKLVDDLFDANDFTAVAHLAALPGVRASLDDPPLYVDVNINGTIALLEAARRQEPTPNFVFASTSSVYGGTTQIPFVETDMCDQPLAPYPASKRATELMGYTYHHIYGMDFTAVRFFTVYGPRNRPDMMAFKLADNIVNGTEVALFNNGQMYRDWTFVDDITKGVVAALDRRLGYDIVNLGRGEPTLLADFVGLIEKRLGKESSLNPEPMPAADMSNTYADISKARKLLDYDPVISVPEGVDAFLSWYEKDGSPG